MLSDFSEMSFLFVLQLYSRVALNIALVADKPWTYWKKVKLKKEIFMQTEFDLYTLEILNRHDKFFENIYFINWKKVFFSTNQIIWKFYV